MATSRDHSKAFFKWLEREEARFKQWSDAYFGSVWMPFVKTAWGAVVTILVLNIVSSLDFHAAEVENAFEEFVMHAVRGNAVVIKMAIAVGLLAVTASWNEARGYLNRLMVLRILDTASHIVALMLGALLGFVAVKLPGGHVSLAEWGSTLTASVVLTGTLVILGAATYYARGPVRELIGRPEARRLVSGVALVALIGVLHAW